jgi:hypothetical protein
VKNAYRVAMSDCVNDLQEHIPHERIPPDVQLLLGDHAEQIPLAVLEHHIHHLLCLDRLQQRHYIGVRGGERVEGELPTLKLLLTSVEVGVGEALDGVELVGSDEVFGEKDHSVGALAELLDELEALGIDLGAEEGLAGGGGGRGGHFLILGVLGFVVLEVVKGWKVVAGGGGGW